MKVRPPKYRLHKGSGQAFVALYGKRVYLGKHGSEESHEKYRMAVAECTRQQLNPATESKTPEPLGISVNKLILLYYRYAEKYYVAADGTSTGEIVIRA